MASNEENSAVRRQNQARNAVRIALLTAFAGAMIGVVFGVVLGDVTGPEAWVISLLTVVTIGLLVLVTARPEMATGAITGILGIYFVFHINAGSILAYAASQDIVLIIPYITWFFPMLLLHHFTNFGFHKRAIGLLVSLGPVPVVAFVVAHLIEPLAIADLAAILSFLVSYFAFVLFVDFYTRHRDEEIFHTARTEESERSADALRVSEERFRLLSRATNDLIWDADLKSRRIWWNDTLLDAYGYDPRAFGFDTSAWESWIHPDDNAVR